MQRMDNSLSAMRLIGRRRLGPNCEPGDLHLAIERRIADGTGVPCETGQLSDRMSLAIHRGNANSIMTKN